jgi:hypothetical protein
MKLTGENRSTRGETCRSAICPPQIPHGLTRDRTRASAVGGRRLTAWAMARPFEVDCWCCLFLTPKRQTYLVEYLIFYSEFLHSRFVKMRAPSLDRNGRDERPIFRLKCALKEGKYELRNTTYSVWHNLYLLFLLFLFQTLHVSMKPIIIRCLFYTKT